MNESNLEKIIDLAAKDTQKGSRVVAKVFYRILRRKGFSENQIIDISTNVLSCLIGSLKGYEKKIEHVNEDRAGHQKKSRHTSKTAARTQTKFRNRYHDYDSDQYNAPL